MASASELITAARERSGLSQRELAAMAGTSRSRLSTYESGEVEPTTGTLERILTPLGLEVEAVPLLRAEDARSLAFGRAVADKLEAAGADLIERARAHLVRARGAGAGGATSPERWWAVWDALLDLGPQVCAEVLRGRSQLCSDLRSTSPFAGVLSAAERSRIIAATRRSA